MGALDTRESMQRGNAMQAQSGLFPLRFLGFGFFWGWLFLVNISPSPLLGSTKGIGNVPFEMTELAARLLFLIGAMVVSSRITRIRNWVPFAVVAGMAGACAAPVVLLSGSPYAVTSAALVSAFAESVLFLMWMTFFGYMKLGETLLLLVSSYAVGAVLCLAAIFLGDTAMTACAVVLPLASCAAMIMARRYGDTVKEEPGGATDKAPIPAKEDAYRSLPFVKMTVGLALYSFGFALYLGIALFLSDRFLFGYVVEPTCAIALACIVLVFAKFSRSPTKPYTLYRAVPPLMGIGFAMLAVGFSQPLLAGFFITLGFLLFEVLAYNDYCNLVKADNSSLLRAIAGARLASSAGMLLGWAVGYCMQPVMEANGSSTILAVLALLFILLIATIAFTDLDRKRLASIAEDRAVQEESEATVPKEEFFSRFAEAIGLSKREEEVLDLLLSGRTTSYAAEKLFVAESTVRAHVHNIYRKTDVHSRMELMDAFDEFWSAHRSEAEKSDNS